MSTEPKTQSTPVSDEAVKTKTGKSWAEWFEILDAAEATQMGHPKIARYLHEQHQVPGWWAQSVTVGYEQARGLREKYQTVEGFRVSASRVIAVPLSQLYTAWADEDQRPQWLSGEPYIVRGTTPNKSMRLNWGEDGRTQVRINFYDKGSAKSQVTIEHIKLADNTEVAAKRQFWQETLDALKQRLEG